MRRGSGPAAKQPVTVAGPTRTDAAMLRALATSLLITVLPASAAAFDCRVTGIADGDTFSCLDALGEHVRVKLAEIDTPELRQPYGSQARQALASHIFSKTVTLTVKGRDDRGRTLARVKVGDSDINSELVRTGNAWANRGYLDDRTLLNLEAVARELGRGLWSLPKADQQPPWEWRQQQRGSR